MKYRNEKEVAERVLKELEDELEGICSYDCLYKMLKEHDMDDEAIVIEHIASDEYRHAEKLWRMLSKFEIDIPQKYHDLWSKVEDIFD
jgi:bacterioferritin (cytochrome b1)